MTLLPLSAGAAVVSGKNGLIAFERTAPLATATGIWVANADGSGQVRITDPATATDHNPAWNAEGTQIVFNRDTTIFTVNVPNPPTGPQTATAVPAASGGGNLAGTDPAFSPDGKKLVYVDTSNKIHVYTFAVTGPPATAASDVQISNTGAADKEPAWNTTGTKIAFARTPTGGKSSIWTMNVDGSGQAQITSSGANDSHPAWSPDGSTIAFQSDRDGTGQIYSVPAGGVGSQTRLTNTNVTGQSETSPAYSADGSKIYFARVQTGAGPTGIYSIPNTGAAAGGETSLTTGSDITPEQQTQILAGAVLIGGTTTQGSTLTASPSGWQGANISYVFQWQRCDSSGFCVNVGTGSTYVTSGVDVGFFLKVTATGSNGGSSATATSSTFGPIIGGPAPINTVLPTITLPTGYDAPQIGFLLSATTGTWTGTPFPTFTYQWTKCDDIMKNCYDIPGATLSFFTPTVDLVNWDISVTITAKNSAGTSYVRAIPTKAVTGVPPSNHGSPVISGQNYVKQTLTTTTGIWQGLAPITFTYQWKRCDAFGTLDSCVAIPGATGTSYVLQTADIDKTIRSFVTATNAIKSVTQFSNHTFPTLPERHFPPSNAGLPAITGLAKPGVLLRTTVGTWSGDTPFTFTYQWERCDATGASCRALKNATRNRYVVTSADLGFTIRVKLTAKNAYGTATIESAPSDAVTRSPRRPKGRRIVGTAHADYLPGSGGDDVIFGLGGNDTILGGAGNDTLYGGPGNDVIDGGPGADKIFGGPGSDTILAADGTKDVIDCGPGNDKAVVDAIDVVKNCESVTIATPSPTPVSP